MSLTVVWPGMAQARQSDQDGRWQARGIKNSFRVEKQGHAIENIT